MSAFEAVEAETILAADRGNPAATSLFGYVRFFVMILVAYGVYFIAKNWFRYRSSVKKRLEEIQDGFQRGLIYRASNDDGAPGKVVRCLELNPEFKKLHEKDWKLVSLGEYLTSLRLMSSSGSSDIPRVLEREIEAMVGAILLQNLGPRFGAAVLPMLGFGSLKSTTAKIVSGLTSWFAAHLLVEAGENANDFDPKQDLGALPFSMAEIAAFANLNEKRGGSKMDIPPLEWFRRGEVGYTPSFGCEKIVEEDPKEKAAVAKLEEDLIPSPFIVARHWEAAIEGMEKRMKAMDSYTGTSPAPDSEHVEVSKVYNPEDLSLPEPSPINERILPGLHLGWGNAKCTHTKREIIRNRLLAVVLNKLSNNYHMLEIGAKDDELFIVKMTKDAKECSRPGEFVEELMRCGHSVEMVPRQTVTTFGMAACIKEADGSWSNVPIAFFFKTGYDRSDGRSAHFAAPHGGLDMSLAGPLVPKRQDGTEGKCDIQYYMAIEGLCGWHSNHNAKVPWLQPHAPTTPFSRAESIRAVCLAGLLACTFNSIGTEMELPFGGYGVLGVCNDTAAIIDVAIRGKTNLYPLISTGRFLMHIASRSLRLYLSLIDKGCKEEAHDMRLLMTAVCTIESDIHTSPSQLIAASNRFQASNPKIMYFELSKESKEILSYMGSVYKEFLEWPKDGPVDSKETIPKTIMKALSAFSPPEKA